MLVNVSELVYRSATFPDAKAIDAMVAALPELRRDLDSWVNQADVEIAAVVGNRVVGYAARKAHREHPQRDLGSVYVEARGDARDISDALYASLLRPRAKPLKLRLPADDLDGIANATSRGFVERIRSATFVIAARDLVGPSTAEEVDYVPRDVFDGFAALYRNTHLWDPAQAFSRRYVRRMLLAGASHVVAIRDTDGRVTAVGAAHASEDSSVAADIALAGAVDPNAADADALTRMVVAKLASFYAEDEPLWFEADHGDGTNEPLARLVNETSAAPRDEVVVLTSD